MSDLKLNLSDSPPDGPTVNAQLLESATCWAMIS